MIELLKDKVAIVTGGASKVGIATAELFLQHGAYVMLADQELSEIKAPRSVATNQWSYTHVDMRHPLDIRACFYHTLDYFGRVDVFFYNPVQPEMEVFLTEFAAQDVEIVSTIKNTWMSLASSLPRIREAGLGKLIVANHATQSVDFREIETDDFRITVDTIHTVQSYTVKRNRDMGLYQQLTANRIARLALSIAIQEKEQEQEWEEVLNWTAEYLSHDS